MTFPCKKCILLYSCKEYCDKLLSSDNMKDDNDILKWLNKTPYSCPDCGGELDYKSFTNNNWVKIICKNCSHEFRSMLPKRIFRVNTRINIYSI